MNLHTRNLLHPANLGSHHLLIVLFKDETNLIHKFAFDLLFVVAFRSHLLFLRYFYHSVLLDILVLLHALPFELFVDLIKFVYAWTYTFVLQVTNRVFEIVLLFGVDCGWIWGLLNRFGFGGVVV